MSEDPSEIHVGDTRALLELLELTGIKYVEFSAKLVDAREVETNFNVGVMQNREGNVFAQRFRMAVEAPTADYVIEVATFYTAKQPVTFDDAVGHDFIERVAAMAAFPFLREGLATAAARLEVEVPIIGLLRTGQFKIGPMTPELAMAAPEG